jgi:hypothetical protein
MARIERMSFDAYNESDVLIQAVERAFALAKHGYGLELVEYTLS